METGVASTIVLQFFEQKAGEGPSSFLAVNENKRMWRWMGHMSYFHPFCQNNSENEFDCSFFRVDDETASTTIPVPCSKDAFMDLYYLAVRARVPPVFKDVLKGMETPLNCRPGFFPSENSFSAALRTADKLGLSQQAQDYLRNEMNSGLLCFDAKLASLCEARWRATSNADGGEALQDVDARWASDVKYHYGRAAATYHQRGDDDHAALFHGSRGGAYDEHCHNEVASGDRIIVTDPPHSVIENCDDRVLRLLQNNAGHLCLAGGSALGLVTREDAVARGNDYDLFLIAGNDDQANDVIVRVLHELTRYFHAPKRKEDDEDDNDEDIQGFPIQESSCALTVELNEPRTKVQLILRRYGDVSSVLNGFDFDVCKIAAWYENENEGTDFHVCATPSCREALASLTIYVDPFSWGSGTLMRCVKYFNKGFNVVVPGVSRDRLETYINNGVSKAVERNWCLCPSCVEASSKMSFRNMPGLIKLFMFEKRVVEELVTRDRKRDEERVSSVDAVVRKIYDAANGLERLQQSFLSAEDVHEETTKLMKEQECLLRSKAIILKEDFRPPERDPKNYVEEAAHSTRIEPWKNLRDRIQQVMGSLARDQGPGSTMPSFVGSSSFYESHYGGVPGASLPPYAFKTAIPNIMWLPRPIPAYRPDCSLFFPRESGWHTVVEPLRVEQQQ